MAVYPALSLFLNFSQTCFSSRSSVASNSEFPELALPADAVPWVCASGATVVDKMSDSKRERLQICLAIDSSFKADRAQVPEQVAILAILSGISVLPFGCEPIFHNLPPLAIFLPWFQAKDPVVRHAAFAGTQEP